MSDHTRTAIIVIGGDPPHPDVVSRLTPSATVIAADSGLDHARNLGLTADRVVGDLDSITADGLAHAVANGAEVQRFPSDKDATDTELAIDDAVRSGHAHVIVVGGAGDRLDHLLGTIAVLAAPRDATVEAYIGTAHVVIADARRPARLDLLTGSVVSLLPIGGPAVGVTTAGLRWPLDGGSLAPHASLGVSNEAVDATVTVRLTAGSLAVVVPHALGDNP